jgi:hypothetical protein
MGGDQLLGKELMGIKRYQVFDRYTKRVFKKAAGEAYLRAIGEGSEDEGEEDKELETEHFGSYKLLH